MRHLNYHSLIIILLCLTLGTGCDTDACPSSKILGLWNLQSLIISDCINIEENFDLSFGNISCVDINGINHCTDGTAEFKNGIFTRTINYLKDGVLDFSDVEIGTYSFSDSDDNLLTICIEDICNTGSVSFTDPSFSWMATQEECNVLMIAGK